LGGGKVWCNWLNIALVNRFRVFFIGFNNRGVCECSTDRWDDIGFKNMCAVSSKRTTDGIIMGGVRRASIKNVCSEGSQKEAEKIVH